ncbi:YbaB/EbfC family nucleoid-associated protein [Gordonia sp. ABSL1-1]|uniref:YbaB/EbfC family nucleoid-associated protein n=1 Tax=Gordonia sp. ABSL1-1 TaxID=3053923 RepID=UPI002574078F|nr:YbaB/EbfC family nucleoid-associated protein [Gordonia sp. ABSL1-1]MDL9937760.1 YbaB/EbfC family nucleoid-associated protein [Gordonia sp. ABSL1-1]
MKTLANSVLARIEQQRDLLEGLQSDTNSIKVRASSPDRSVTVEVDSTCAMTGLWLTPGITKHSATTLATLIVETAQHAARAALARRNELVRQFTTQMGQQQNAPLERWDGTTVTPQRPVAEMAPPVADPPSGDK